MIQEVCGLASDARCCVSGAPDNSRRPVRPPPRAPNGNVVASDTTTLKVIDPFDLDVDSDNTNGTGEPDYSQPEEDVEGICAAR